MEAQAAGGVETQPRMAQAGLPAEAQVPEGQGVGVQGRHGRKGFLGLRQFLFRHQPIPLQVEPDPPAAGRGLPGRSLRPTRLHPGPGAG